MSLPQDQDYQRERDAISDYPNEPDYDVPSTDDGPSAALGVIAAVLAVLVLCGACWLVYVLFKV